MRHIYRSILVVVLMISAGCGAPAGTPAPTDTPAPTPSVTPLIGDTTPVFPVSTPSAPFDALFMDSMASLLQTTLLLAESALEQAEREELRAHAQTLTEAFSAQRQQIIDWRAAWYADIPASAGLPTNMAAATLEENADVPFDLRFLNAMISQQRVNYEIARLGQAQAQREELRTLAETLAAASDASATQLEAWRQQWFSISG
ncbi:MAG: DUF305 domain-containing protein [Chloroflexi bacterium]|nr:DUF305 domain-containing protein [Chloroflexota bacterium]